MEQGYPQATPEEGWCTSLWIDTHLLEMRKEANYEVKRWPSAKSKDDPVQVKTKVYLVEPKDLDYLQKFLLRVVAT
jgi:hypothetical protein